MDTVDEMLTDLLIEVIYRYLNLLKKHFKIKATLRDEIVYDLIAAKQVY